MRDADAVCRIEDVHIVATKGGGLARTCKFLQIRISRFIEVYTAVER